jgi:hypothetical protein
MYNSSAGKRLWRFDSKTDYGGVLYGPKANRDAKEEGRTMNAEKPCHRYSGVTRHEGKWMAKFRHAGRDLNLGHYDTPEQAALAADFARYLCLGINAAMWHPNVGRPNFSPRACDDVPRRTVLTKLLRQTALSPSALLRRMEEFDAAAEQNGGSCACR